MRIYNLSHQKQIRQKLRNNMPRAEWILWMQIRNSQFKGLKFRRQHGIGRYVADFYCPKLKLVIELDGDSHFEKGAQEYDKNRQAEIELLGIEFIRFRNNDIYHNLNEVLDLLEKKAAEIKKAK